MNNADIGKIFFETGELLEITGEIIFKIRAYFKAAEILSTYPEDLEKLYNEGGVKKLMEIPGVGKAIAEKIEEYIKTGKVHYYEELKKKLPEGILELLSVQGVGPKKAKYFYEKLGIKNRKDLEKAAKEHKLKDLPGMGEKSEGKILKSLELSKRDNERVLLGTVLPIAESIQKELLAGGGVGTITVAGSVRRGKETVGDIDILVTSTEPEKVIRNFTGLKNVSAVLSKGPTKASVKLNAGLQADLRVLEAESFGAALNYFTGSKAHNVALREIAIKKGLKLSEYGLFKEEKNVSGSTEDSLYRKLGLSYVEPELRENRGEIEAARAGKLPELVELKDIAGDLHMHTTASDGTTELPDLIAACRKKGYKYIGITDHSQSLKVARGLSVELILERIKKIAAINKKLPGFRVLAGSEVDIKPDGTLDYDDGVLDALDYAIGSVHLGFTMKKEEMTRRVIKAIKSKKIKILGHPTGRLLGEREGYEINISEVIKAAADYNVALELSGSPYRLDLSDINCRAAKEKGAFVCINTDTHAIGELDNMKYGVITAKRGWLEKKNVVNCLPLADFMKFLKK